MWFPTKEKVSKRIDALLNEAEHTLDRVQFFYQQDQIIGPIIGSNDMAFRASAECKAAYDSLIEAQAQIRFGMRPPRTVDITVSAAAQVLKANQKLLGQMERANASGVAMASAHLGTN